MAFSLWGLSKQLGRQREKEGISATMAVAVLRILKEGKSEWNVIGWKRKNRKFLWV
jgi:hypothetical protein